MFGIVAAVLLCGLLISCTRREAPTEIVASSGLALSAETRRVTIALPSGTALASLAAVGATDVKVGDRARVLYSNGTFAPVANSGIMSTQIGFEAAVGTLTSDAGVMLRDRATVGGNVVSRAGIEVGTNVVVTGTTSPDTRVTFDAWSWTVNLPASGSVVTVPVNGSRNLAPGSYASVQAFSGARLNLVAGTYYFDSLSMEPQSVLGVDTRNGAVRIYARQNLIFRGATTFTGPNDRLLILYLGTTAPALDRSFNGTLVAPNATVRLGVGGSPYVGAVFAKSLTLDPDVRFTLRPFSGWSAFTFDLTPRFECVEGRGGTSKVAVFGYFNPGQSPVTVGVGSNNQFLSAPINRGQSTYFLPGSRSGTFAVGFSGTPPRWSLRGVEATIDPAKTCIPTFSVSAPADTTVKAMAPLASYGTDLQIEVGNGVSALVSFDREALLDRRGLASFVRSARLELSVKEGSGAIVARPMRKAWSETQATWVCGRDQDLLRPGWMAAARGRAPEPRVAAQVGAPTPA